MAMSDTEMALALGANQLAAMRPVDPGAFSGIQPNMAPPMGGAMSDQEAMMMGGAAPDLNSQEGMMRYLQEKVRQIRERTGGGAMSDADMGALEAVMQSMPQANQPRPAPAMPPAQPPAQPPMGAQR